MKFLKKVQEGSQSWCMLRVSDKQVFNTNKWLGAQSCKSFMQGHIQLYTLVSTCTIKYMQLLGARSCLLFRCLIDFLFPVTLILDAEMVVPCEQGTAPHLGSLLCLGRHIVWEWDKRGLPMRCPCKQVAQRLASSFLLDICSVWTLTR